MAFVRELRREPGSRNQRHGETRCTYKVFAIDGETYLQLNAFGSAARADDSHHSQTLQFDRQSLRQLRDIIDREVMTDR